jgi:16S rRNA processing protein RimM
LYFLRINAMDWDSMALVGRVVRPHGHRGQVVVAPETDFGDDRFAAGATVSILREARVQSLKIEASFPHQGRWVVGLEGVDNMNDAEALRGYELRVPADSLHELGAGSYYVHDLIGCEVHANAAGLIGRVARVDVTAGIPLLVVGTGPGEDDEVLVPLSDAICRTVDVKSRRIEIDPPEGLIDLNRRK